jgi:hypothetical protein
MYSFTQSSPAKAQTPNLKNDQEWSRMKRELDLDYQLKLKAVNDEAMQKLTAYREEHKMATQRMQ